jgi:hypothetical protein
MKGSYAAQRIKGSPGIIGGLKIPSDIPGTPSFIAIL